MIDEKMMTKKIKPCPFCGGKAVIIKCPHTFPPINETQYYIKCEKCKVHSIPWSVSGSYMRYDEDKKLTLSECLTDDVVIAILVKRWNKRIKIKHKE